MTLVSGRMSTSFVLRVIYGYNMASEDDYFVKLGEKGVLVFERACVGAWAVNFFPLRKSLAPDAPCLEGPALI